MKRMLAAIPLVVALSSFISAQTTNPQNIQADGIEQQLNALLYEYADALKKMDVGVLNRILADDYIEVSISGTVDPKAKVLEKYRARQSQPNTGGGLQAVKIDETSIRVHGNTSVIVTRLILTSTVNGQPSNSSLRVMFVCVKQQGQWQFVAAQMGGIRPPQPSPNLTTFEFLPVPDKVKNLAWIKLMEDKPNDGRQKETADGKAFYYFFDKATDMLWFRLDLYNEVNRDAPAISVSIDTDADQNNGINWYGANTKFRFEKMLSVGPTQKQGDKYIGYNGITDEKGVRERNWINDKKGIITAYFSKETNSYFLGVKRSDLDPALRKFNVIGSVGANALWNDDIGEEGYSTIQLDIAK